MGYLEARIHNLLKEAQPHFSSSPHPAWPHALTMGRLVARALRLQQSLLVQTSCLPETYALSYLLPCLLADRAVQIIATPERQQCLQQQIIPELQHWLEQVSELNATSAEGYQPLSIVTTTQWLQQNLFPSQPNLRASITLIDHADELEIEIRRFFSRKLMWPDWQVAKMGINQRNQLLHHWSRLSQSIFSRPQNPYHCYSLNETEQQLLRRCFLTISEDQQSPTLRNFWQFWRAYPENHLLWAMRNAETGSLEIHIAPVNLSPLLTHCWQNNGEMSSDQPPSNHPTQAVIIIGGFLDVVKDATTFREAIGLGDLLCLKFLPQKRQSALTVYLPETFPLPNTPAFQPRLFAEIEALLHRFFCPSSALNRADQFSTPAKEPDSRLRVVILLDDSPLKVQLGSEMAAKFGSGVKVEPPLPKETETFPSEIIVSSWQYWCRNQSCFSSPDLLILATLPIPSLENPLVNSRVQFHKRHHQDWFRRYLLPTALRDLQQVILPLRSHQGQLAILDDRVNSRSYGQEVMNVLTPYTKSRFQTAIIGNV